MLSVKIDAPRLKAMAVRLREQFTQRGMQLNHQSALQIVSQTVFDKPYEEIKATLLQDDTPAPDTPTTRQVSVLHYRSETLLLVDADYITGCYPGTDLEIPLRALLDQGHALAAQHNTRLNEVHLPEILAPDYETDDIIALAERMGFLKTTPSIFDQFDKVDSGHAYVLIDHGQKTHSLNGDYLGELESAAENDNVPDDVTVWMPEYHDEDGFHEYFVSFGELCQATTEDGGITWTVPVSGQEAITVHFAILSQP